MPKITPPELKKFMDKKLNSKWVAYWVPLQAGHHHQRHDAFCLQPTKLTQLHAVTLNANRQVTGVLRGFDQFMNMVLDGTVDVKNKIDIGMVVGALCTSAGITKLQRGLI
jgi:small nuclear ribonucleoprotein G